MSANEVRIIGGRFRSRRLRFTPRENLRPTPDRVRETLFNWLGQDLTGLSCLDLFAGSGALGFEAASRGAARVTLVENDRVACDALARNLVTLTGASIELMKADALEFVRRKGCAYDIVFADPPFIMECWTALLPLLPPRMNVGARVYCESEAPVPLPPGWSRVREGRAGRVSFQLITLDA